jgi:putative ATPase
MEQLSLDMGTSFSEKEQDTFQRDVPLAMRLRPKKMSDYIGQKHLLSEGKLLRRAIDADRFSSILFWGPPGVGKTSLAEIIAKTTDSAFISLSGVSSTVADIRKAVKAAIERKKSVGKKTILFIDEIHRFNKAQQDVLLPDVEAGIIRLIGATTHNPHFYVIPALLSRSLLFQLNPLTEDDIGDVIDRALNDELAFKGEDITIEKDAIAFLATACEGDARKALNAFEIAALTTESVSGNVLITKRVIESSIQKKALVYDDDAHYDTISAFIKSMRGSDPNAAVYWLAKMLEAGEDIRFIARRLTIFASEDIGNADPRAITLTASVMDAIEKIGMPEARIILSQAVTYCATAPKSNASYKAIELALEDVKKNRILPVPTHLKDAHYQGAESLGHGSGYKYPHNEKGGFVVQDYLGVEKEYYHPVNLGYETKIRERMAFWNQSRSLKQL